MHPIHRFRLAASAAALSCLLTPGWVSANSQASPSPKQAPRLSTLVLPAVQPVVASVGNLAGTLKAPIAGLQNAVAAVPRTLLTSLPLTLPGLPGAARAPRTIDVTLVSPVTGDKVAITVFEPAGFVAGQTYPLVLHGHGFGLSRLTGQGTDIATPGSSDLNLSQGVADLVAGGYGVISIDQRGHGQSSGAVRVMDPDVEGQNLIAVLDWAEANLPWLMYRPTADGRDPRNLVVGSVGGSYGGMFQLLLAHIDPKQRLDAIVPEIAPHSLNYSLAPQNTPKTIWSLALFGLGTTAGRMTGSTFDPFVLQEFPQALINNRFSPGLADFAAYHSTSYWCEGRRVATNGAPGRAPGYAPTLRPKINALFIQGMRDTLFNLNNAVANHQCLAARGGDVRLMTTQVGHNTIPVVPDLDVLRFQNPLDITKGQCGRLTTMQARRAFLDEHLKGVVGAANAVPKQACVSLTADDAVLLPPSAVAQPTVKLEVPATSVTAGLGGPAVVVPLGDAVDARGRVLAGIPMVDLTLQANGPAVPPTIPALRIPGLVSTSEINLSDNRPIVFVGVGVMHTDGRVELVDNQVTPVRGLGRHLLPLAGVGQRLSNGQRLALLVYGAHEQFLLNGSVALQPMATTVQALMVRGSVTMPLHDAQLPTP